MLGVGTIPATGAGQRMMWHPYKAAFRAGSIGSNGTEWDDANVGFYTAAFGYNTIALGLSAFSAGYQSHATGTYSTATGYNERADGTGSVAVGYQNGAFGDYSVTLGQRAYSGTGCPTTANTSCNYDATPITAHKGAFVFSDDSTVTHFGVGADNMFAARAAGGFRFRTKNDLTTGCDLPAGSGVFSCSSDRATKKDFKPVRGQNVLERIARLPITTWSFKTEKAGVRHMGPMAQDFWRQFHLGTDNKNIGLTDLNGVNLAGIQALYRLDQQKDVRIRHLERENARINARLDRIERLLAKR